MQKDYEFDIIFILGEIYFDHPLCGAAILKRLLEEKGFKVGVIEQPRNPEEIRKLGKPNLFFAVSTGSIDSMVRNYTPLKKLRVDDKNINYTESVPNRAIITYSNWVRQMFKDSIIVLGGIEPSLRRFSHYDYWDNKIRKPILFDSRADLLIYGPAEKQIVETAKRLKENKNLFGIEGTAIIVNKNNQESYESYKEKNNIIELPSFDEINTEDKKGKEKYIDMQNLFSVEEDLIQKIDNRSVLQFKLPKYTTQDLDKYYGFKFTRVIPSEFRHLRGFEFSIVTHRGCIGDCNFCSLRLMQGKKIISRSEESILEEIEYIASLPNFRGNIDDLGGPSANMYGMDCKCNKEEKDCINCNNLDKSNLRLIQLLNKAKKIQGVKNVYIRSGIRYELASDDYIETLLKGNHIYDTLKIAPEHIDNNVLILMNKNVGDLDQFIKKFEEIKKDTNSSKILSYYFMIAHPGCNSKETKELKKFMDKLKIKGDAVQVFTPTPMTVSTCMYYTGMNPKSKEDVYVPYSYKEKKEQKRIFL
jgi:uncharacterized radical SAM protein YgiQ